MRMRKTARFDERGLAQERTTAVRKRQDKTQAADRKMTTSEAHPDQLEALQKVM